MLPVREEKKAVVEELTQKLKEARAIFVTDYKGIPVAQLTELRRRLRAAESSFKVSKNTLTRIAAHEAGVADLVPMLEGQIALTFSFGDPASAAKVLNEFTREFKMLEIKGGILQGRPLTSDQVKALAELPPYEVMIARVVGGIKAPLYGLVGVLSGPIRNLVYVLKAIEEKKAAS